MEPVRARYPEATFRVVRNPEDCRGIDLLAIADHEQMDDVLDLVIDRVMEFPIEQHLPIHVIPLHPTHAAIHADPPQHGERDEAQPTAVPHV